LHEGGGERQREVVMLMAREGRVISAGEELHDGIRGEVAGEELVSFSQ
jgi:hypothetical protein